MKNIHTLPTYKPGNGFILGKCIKELSDVKIGQFTKTYYLMFTEEYFQPHNIYITNDEEEAYTYALHIKKQEVLKINGIGENSKELFHDKGFNYQYECKKIILTTDDQLIKDGVQAIDDEFLEWFIKNPSYEFVDVYNDKSVGYEYDHYSIIIPKEKTKQEKLLQVAERYSANELSQLGFINGAKWQEQQTIEEVFEWLTTNNYLTDLKETLINNFKNK
jgi:hypothetical protein